MYFALSSDVRFSERGEGAWPFSLRQFYLSLVKTVQTWPAIDRNVLLLWWNRYVTVYQSIPQPHDMGYTPREVFRPSYEGQGATANAAVTLEDILRRRDATGGSWRRQAQDAG